MITAPTIIIACVLAILTLSLPRKFFLVPYVVGICFVPADQRIIIMGLDFTILRILIVAGVVRILLRSEQKNIVWNNFDKLLFGWAICGAVVYVIRESEMSALIYKSGRLFDIVGLYWLFKQSIRSLGDFVPILKLFAVCAILMAPLVVLEFATGRNPFLYLGRVQTAVREGGYRCQASFPHSIIFGVFWANLIPIFLGCAIAERRRFLYWLAIAAAVFMVIVTRSSTPYGVLATNLVLLLVLFRYRRYGRYIALGLCGLTAALHIVMNAPVWHLLARINIVGGSTGWHRFHLINETVKHFGEWAMVGTSSTLHWGAGMHDITNQYCLEGINGGLITLVLFVIVLIIAVRTVGRYSLQNIPRNQQWLAWGICVSILGHCVSFIGVSYFGQIHMLLYLTFAIAGLTYEMSCNSVHLTRPAKSNLAVVNIS